MSTKGLHPFVWSIQLQSQGNGRYYTNLDDAYALPGGQIHGGLILATAFSAARAEVLSLQEGLSPVSLTAQFLSRSEPGKADVKVRIHRRGANFVYYHVKLRQKGQVIFIVFGIFGRREGYTCDLLNDDTRMPSILPPEQCVPPDANLFRGPKAGRYECLYPKDKMEAASKSIEMSANGKLPDGFLEEYDLTWLSWKDGPNIDEAALCFFCDVGAPLNTEIYLSSKGLRDHWSATISLTLYFHQPPAQNTKWILLRDSGFVIGQRQIEARQVIWDQSGRILATSYQLAVTAGTMVKSKL